jgi:hypothetical protein
MNKARTSLILTLTLLFLPLALLAQQPEALQSDDAKKKQTTMKHESTMDSRAWADRIDENDVRVLGKVTEVREETFLLRTHDQGVMTFAIPTQYDYSADLRTGNEIQVWYNPADADEEALSSTYEVAVIAPADVTLEQETDVAAQTELDSQERAQERARLEREQAAARADLAAEGQTTTAQVETTEPAQSRFQADRDNELDQTSYDDDDDRGLPQTASVLPLLGLLGLIAAGVALSVRVLRR